MDNYLPSIDDMSEAQLRSEFRLLGQAVWDALAALGYDTDGDPTPGACRYRLGPELVQLARETWEDLRSAYRELNRSA